MHPAAGAINTLSINKYVAHSAASQAVALVCQGSAPPASSRGGMTRIIIFGCGGIGGYVGGMLSRSAAAVRSSPNDACSSAAGEASSRRRGAGGGGSCEITMVDAWAEHVDAMKAAGLGITCGLHRGTFPAVRVRALHLHEVSCAGEALPPPVPLGRLCRPVTARQPLALR
eukprot:COSAG01_NODE_2641_length_7322_cov_115.896456_9_plen_171_part_00